MSRAGSAPAGCEAVLDLALSPLVGLAASSESGVLATSAIRSIRLPIVIVLHMTVAFRRRYSVSRPVAGLSSVVVASIYVVVQFVTWIAIGSLIDRIALVASAS